MPYREFDGELDQEGAAPSAPVYREFDGELDPVPKKSVIERVTDVGAALRNAPDPLRDKMDADRAAKGSVMERVPAPAPTAAAPAPAKAKPLGLFAGLQGTDVLPAVTATAQETRDMIDPSAEARTRRLARNGMNADQAKYAGKRAAAAGVLPGMEGAPAKMEATDVDFATRRKYNEDPVFSNPALRAAVKGVEGYKQGIAGLNQFAADMVGADELAGDMANASKKSRAFTEAMGTPTGHFERNFEGAVSSIAQQLPSLVAGVATGSEALTLGSMFAQTFGSEYGSGRAQGQSAAEAAQRAGLFGAFEVVGEKLGLGQQLNLLRNSARGVETNALAKFMANTLTKELPGESVTTTGQFLTDKLGDGIGLNPQAGLESYLTQMADTVTQTVMQGGIMAGGGAAINQAAHRFAPARADDGTAAAEAARTDALNRWETSGLRPGAPAAPASPESSPIIPGPAPAAPERREPSIADIGAATSVDEAIAAAQAVVSKPVTPHATPADIDALEAAALTQQAGGIADAVLPPNVAASAGGRDQLAAGIGAGDTGPVEAAGGLPAKQPQAVALDEQPDGPDLVRAGAGPDAQPALTPIRDAIDRVVDPATDWHAFPKETGTRGIPRADMPQIKAEHRGAMTQFLKARGITHEEVELPAEDLKPTQAEFSLEKVNKALNYEGGERSILVSNDGHVLDGHHQWLAAVDAERPVKAIVLNAPIQQLLDTVREFPSAGLDTASAPAPSKLEQARAKHQRQEEAVRLAAQNIAARKSTGGDRARERVKSENPFLHFLASTGVSQEDRKDSGAERGRMGNPMVPGFGPVYRRSGKRLDELALLARDAGFLTDQDIEDAGDTGGTRKLADMIARALQNKEVIREVGAVEQDAPSADEQLLAEAQKLGIETEGKTADQVYDAVVAAHADNFTPAQEQIAAQLDDDINLDGLPSELTDEEIDGIFGFPAKPAARLDGGQAQENTAGAAPRGAERAGQASESDSLLSSYTPAEVRARQDADTERARASRAERDKLEAQSKKRRDDADVQSRMDASADNFTLGQSADDALAGQQDLLSQPDAADPDIDIGADIPRSFFKKVKVDHDVWIEDEGAVETIKERADIALRSVREDIANLEALVKCMKG